MAAIGAQLSPSNRGDYDRNVAAVRAALGPVFESEWTKGRTLTLGRAIAYAEEGGQESGVGSQGDRLPLATEVKAG